MGDASIVATAFRYPREGSLEALNSGVAAIEHASTKRSMKNFVDQIGLRPLDKWEELHTETLDLSPKFAPYVGHAVWGETSTASYRTTWTRFCGISTPARSR